MLRSVIIQANKFLKGDWLKQVIFQPNLKYLHVGISVPCQPLRTCFDFQTRWRRDSQNSNLQYYEQITAWFLSLAGYIGHK